MLVSGSVIFRWFEWCWSLTIVVQLLGPGWNLISQWPWLVLLFSLWLRTTYCWDRLLGGFGRGWKAQEFSQNVHVFGVIRCCMHVAHIALWILLFHQDMFEKWSLVCLFQAFDNRHWQMKPWDPSPQLLIIIYCTLIHWIYNPYHCAANACGSFLEYTTITRSFVPIFQVFLWALSGIWAYWSCWHSP